MLIGQPFHSWIKGELIGGCDIICEMAESGELETLIKESVANSEATDAE